MLTQYKKLIWSIREKKSLLLNVEVKEMAIQSRHLEPGERKHIRGLN
jgi:hypothetical protein